MPDDGNTDAGQSSINNDEKSVNVVGSEVDPMQWDTRATCMWIKAQGLDDIVAQV